MWKAIGTEEVVGAVLIEMSWSEEMYFEKDGRKFRLELERDWGYCYCYPDRCSCTPSVYWKATEEVADEEPKKKGKKK